MANPLAGWTTNTTTTSRSTFNDSVQGGQAKVPITFFSFFSSSLRATCCGKHLRGCSILIALFHFHWQHISNFFIQLHFPPHLLLIFPSTAACCGTSRVGILAGASGSRQRCQGQFALVYQFCYFFSIFIVLNYI